uniref:ATP synthase F0 subunit 8 n=1 Tax=Aeolothrips xinjiangensis TaxID=2942826 RepID=UPI0020283488|nr:ATP synthase F0 subunit 8 [Aeolothrips xinjiangensis]UQJ77465.1 ATP synthase F0 subunit 8 [Aeolothrips xinjiangensis]
MPQMNPMSWLTLFFFFMLVFYIYFSFLYFCYPPKKKTNNLNYKVKTSKYWFKCW